VTIDERLKSLNITLPPTPTPLADYVSVVRTGNLVFVSGQGPMVDGKPVIRGKLGASVSEEDGIKAARLAAINALAVLSGALGGLETIVRVVKLNGYVNCTDNFERQHIVVNGASELFVEVFGERGRHARAAIGTNALPMGIPVEIELTVEMVG
jgi:enamine deaminase RidA (YjgF/YER057c/UK114 family)